MASGPEAQDRRAVLQNALAALDEMQARLDAAERVRTEPVAIVGMACRFPGGADTPERFWALLRDGVDAVTDVPPDRWDINEFFDPDPDAEGKVYTGRAGLLSHLDLFDPLFFGMAPREATTLDPQQRLLLEVSWEALERAGQAPAKLKDSRTGVFVGIGSADYGQLLAKSGAIDTYSGSGAGLSFAAGRLSYTLGLRGPSMAVDTACSSALVAVHLAVQSLRNGECSMALAGGVHVTLTPETWIYLSRVRALAPDGRCKAFDAEANGFVRGEGCGIVVLKRLSDAVKDGDEILAVIRGSAVNQDGASGGLTVPNGVAQQALIEEALERGGVAPADVSYVEAHGTGTSLGDPIEVGALQRVLGRGRPPGDALVVGSVKTNIGHLEAAAGIAGLIKAILAIRHAEIPANLHFQKLNPAISNHPLPISIPTALVPWNPAGKRIAGVSAFGLSGTNAHVIVEEPPASPGGIGEVDRPRHLLTLTARSESALRDLAARYRGQLSGECSPIQDVCFTANAGRSHFDHRLAVTGTTAEELSAGLEAWTHAETLPRTVIAGRFRGTIPPKVGFALTGQGSQYAGMGRALYATQPTFRAAIDRCAAILQGELAAPLLDVLYPAEAARSPIDETGYTQPALFAIEYALAELWRSWGIQPAVVLGHSIGEYVAACVAGVFSLDDALRLVAARGRLMQGLPAGGTMAAVGASAMTVRAAIAAAPAVEIAAINGPGQVVIAGPQADVARVVAVLEAQGISAQTLTTSHAFHSALLEPMLDAFEAVAQTVTYHAPQIPVISNLTGQVAAGDDLVTPGYWRRHARSTVQWATSLQTLETSGCGVVVEIGPTATLTALGQSQTTVAWRPSLRRGRDDWSTLLDAVAHVYVAGAPIDWAGFDRDYARRKVALPTYPFQRERYWIEAKSTGAAAPVKPRLSSFDPANWLYDIDWEPVSQASNTIEDASGLWLIFGDRAHVPVCEMIQQLGGRCVFVRQGQSYELDSDGVLRLDPTNAAHFDRLYDEVVGSSGETLRGIIHGWSLEHSARPGSAPAAEPAHVATSASVLHLAQVLLRRGPGALYVLTCGAQPVASSRVNPDQAPVWGLCRGLRSEHPELTCVCIDIDPQPSDVDASQFLAAFGASSAEPEIAIRNGNAYVSRMRRSPIRGDGAPAQDILSIRGDRSYLITGGYGALGLAMTRSLIAQGARHLALMGRRGATRAAQEVIDQLAALGADGRVFAGDVAVEADVRRVIDEIGSTMPPLAGVIHAAGTLDDGALLQQNWQRFERVLAPKVSGALHLHRHTKTLPLEFFVLFSSVSSLFGSRGQSNYAAANAYLDAFAHYRRAEGLPALTINWGPWADAGMAAAVRGQTARQWRSQGIGLITAAEGAAALEYLIRSNRPQVAVLAIDWAAFARALPAGERPLLLSAFVEASVPPAGQTSVPELLARLEHTRPDERERIVFDYVRVRARAVMGLSASFALEPHQGLRDLGLDSLMAVELRNVLQRGIGRALPATLAFDFPTVEALTAKLLNCMDAGDRKEVALPPRGASVVAPIAANEPIAIVGVGCRFPGGASGPGAFWNLLREGFDAIREIPADRWDIDAYYDQDVDADGKMYTRRGGFLDRLDLFDAAFFGIAPREAASLDPQQRLLLEVSWEALEHAGLPPDRLMSTETGVFVGISGNEYGALQARFETPQDLYFATGNSPAATAGRLSYVLGLQGPSMAVDTACSSSLVAVHLAVQSLRSGECSTALAAGINALLSPDVTVTLCRAQMLSPAGECRTFDAAADGYVRGEGCGVIVLKRLTDATRDGDRVLAVIAGTAVNQDGRSSGLTAPNGPAQEQVVRRALSSAGIQPAEVAYVEVHGTGTPLGDPIEVHALGGVFGEGRTANNPLLVGSVKTNIGHLEAAAGIAGLIKVVLSLEHGEIPAHLHFTTPNPNIAWSEMPVKVSAVHQPWPGDAHARRVAGVSSFGFTGTNAHVVLQSAPVRELSAAERPAHPTELLTFSAKHPDALRALAASYARYLESQAANLADFCYTANTGRAVLRERAAVVGGTADEVRHALAAFSQGDNSVPVVCGVVEDSLPPKVAFVFTGEPQVSSASRELYDTQPAFRRAIDACAALVTTEKGRSSIDTLSVGFAIEYALAELWQSWGIRPALVIGDENELAAACVAGALSLEDALKLALARDTSDAYPQLAKVERTLPRVPLLSRDDVGLATLTGYVTLQVGSSPSSCGVTGLLSTAARLFVAGVAIDWESFYAGRSNHKIALPTYPFQRQRHWIDASGSTAVQPLSGPGEYELIWKSVSDARPIEEANLPRKWVICSDRAGVGTALAGQLSAMDKEVRLFYAEPPHGGSARDSVSLDLQDAIAGGGTLVYLWGLDVLDITAPHDLGAASSMECTRLAAVVRAVVAANRPAKVWVVTRSAQAVDGFPMSLSLAQAPLWGIAKVVALEHPAVWGGAIDLESGIREDELAASLLREMSTSDSEDQIALRGSQRHALRLTDRPNANAKELRCGPDASYVVTGGLGSLGLRAARRLVERGARHVFLVGRRGLPERKEWARATHDEGTRRRIAAVQEMEELGATIETVGADVADLEQMSALIATIGRSSYPLKGIVHAAGASIPEAIADLDSDNLAAVMRPKVTGAWVLHQLTARLSLDFFVVYSSIASVWGSQSLASYAAANQFLDALAHHRRSLGLPALSVNWGPWSGGGMTTDAVQTGLAALGVRALASSQALDALERVMHGDRTQVTIADVDWGTFKAMYLARASRRLFDLIDTGASEASRDLPPAAALDELMRQSPADRLPWIADRVGAEVSAVLGSVGAIGVGPDERFFDLGMDSLMTVELRRRLERRFGRALPPTLAFDYPTVSRLATYLLRELGVVDGVANAHAVDSGSELPLDRIAQLSDEEVERMFAEKVLNHGD